MMLRLLLLSVILTAKVVTSLEDDGSGYLDDTEQGDDEVMEGMGRLPISTEVKPATGELIESDDGNMLIIIVAAVSVVALAIVAVIAVFLFRRHLQNREQGVYTVPIEQGQKCV